MTSTTTIAVLTEHALVALDLTASIEELFPSAEVVVIPPPLSSVEPIMQLSGLLAVIVDQVEARNLDLDAIREKGASVIVLGDQEPHASAEVTYLQLPFTTEMFARVITRLSRPIASPNA